jgi:hypothetical protein
MLLLIVTHFFGLQAIAVAIADLHFFQFLPNPASNQGSSAMDTSQVKKDVIGLFS